MTAADPNHKRHSRRSSDAGPPPGAVRRSVTCTGLTTAEGHRAEITVHLHISADRKRATAVPSARQWIDGHPHPWAAPSELIAEAIRVAAAAQPVTPEIVPSLKMLR